ncbi:MAG TPA: hypothetical protein VFC19_24115 [Candidatus Limnocylindrales bacterium]|nr:hypothetical protein [Candidatus Limnocylindrales bacterium]
MTTRVLAYNVGNEHDPGDPWGRSELVIQPDGTARLDHFFSRRGPVGAWTGRVDAGALEALWSALEQAGFPDAPTTMLTAGATPRRLTVEADGVSQRVMIDYHGASKLPGYAEAFDLLDAIVRQLSEDAVDYPTNQPATVVSDVAKAHG